MMHSRSSSSRALAVPTLLLVGRWLDLRTSMPRLQSPLLRPPENGISSLDGDLFAASLHIFAQCHSYHGGASTYVPFFFRSLASSFEFFNALETH
jgi:hypothetical protein